VSVKMPGRSPEAVLITGLFGTGKSSVAAEIADILEKQGLPYAALDLDWFAWFATATNDGPSEHEMMLWNLTPVLANYLKVGVRFFVLARALRRSSEVDSFRRALSMPLKVVRLTVPLEEVRRRLEADATSGRKDDLRDASSWLAAGEGEGIEDWAESNNRPIRGVAAEILEQLGWLPVGEAPTGSSRD
jgi:chloramphenicol 3-O-phosphotransferase